MKRRRRTKDRSLRVIRLWKYADAAKASPYLRSLVNSLRDHWLLLQNRHLAARRLQDLRKPSRHDRIALDDTLEEARRAENEFDDTLQELMSLDIFLLDPVRGQALIPFQEGEELAWFVFDLFDEKAMTSWRYHKDPLETRRPVPEGRHDADPPLIAAAAGEAI